MDTAPADSSSQIMDWSSITHTVECPLCLYNLRGLTEPRCPECGYKFQWAELLDPQRARHRYLFEHQPNRNVWSFCRTLLGGLRPVKFWTQLKPTQMLDLRRLMIYWLLCSALLVLVPGVEYLRLAGDLASSNARSRFMVNFRGSSLMSPQKLQQVLDTHYPLPPSRVFFRQLWSNLNVQNRAA